MAYLDPARAFTHCTSASTLGRAFLSTLLVVGALDSSACARPIEDGPRVEDSSSAGSGGSGGTGGGVSLPGLGGAGTTIGCSPDLQRVVDASGTVLATCAPEEGCLDGACVPACDAAAGSKGSIGCQFWAPDPPFFDNGDDTAVQRGPCYAVFIANAWTRPAKITVSRGGQTFDLDAFGRIPKGVAPDVSYEPIPASGLPAGEVAVLFLSHRPGTTGGAFTPDCPDMSFECPVPPAVLDDAAVQGSGVGHAFRVDSDTPVSAYDIVPYGGATSFLPSASLLFPSTSWGTNYLALAPHGSDYGKLWALIVGADDGTIVKINSPSALPGGGGLATSEAGVTTTFSLDAGQTLQWIGGDPTSAIIEADKPVGVWTGNTYLDVKTLSMGPGGLESTHQQISHVRALGSEYLAAGVVSRMTSGEPESVLYRVMGVVDGTELEFDPAGPAAKYLGAGQTVEFETAKAFRVRSQDTDHPFVLTQYMSGASAYGTVEGCGTQLDGCGVEFKCNLGDEEWVNLIPTGQYLQRYVFFTDPTYATTNLVITRVKGAQGFHDVSLGCLGTISGWQPLGSSGLHEYAHVDLVRGGVPVASCGTSRHEASSEGAFGILVWGTDWYSSYGYPAGGNSGIINDVVVSVPK